MINLADKFRALSFDDKRKFLDTLSIKELEALYQIPELFLFDKQIAPPGNWRYHLFMAGRGSGKTVASTFWLYEKIIKGAKEVAIMGPDFATLTKEIQPIFESHFPANKKPHYNGQYHFYTCYNGCIVKIYSSDQEVRGNNAEFAIVEEICKWCDSIPEKIQERFDIFDLSVRKGKNPQIFISSTPKPISWFFNFKKEVALHNPNYSFITCTTFDNPFLSDRAKDVYKERFGSSRVGRAELMAELIEDVDGALWKIDLLDKCRISDADFRNLLESKLYIQRTVVAVDPAVTANEKSDETGIIIAHLCSDNHVYVIADLSGKYSPAKWAKITIKAYNDFQADRIVAEKNQGGDLVSSNIHSVDPHAPVKLVTATKGKIIRAEPVSSLYERGKVHHVGNFSELEFEMTHYTGSNKSRSPDRLDALTYCVTELLLSQSYVSRDVQNVGVY